MAEFQQQQGKVGDGLADGLRDAFEPVVAAIGNAAARIQPPAEQVIMTERLKQAMLMSDKIAVEIDGAQAAGKVMELDVDVEVLLGHRVEMARLQAQKATVDQLAKGLREIMRPRDRGVSR